MINALNNELDQHWFVLFFVSSTDSQDELHKNILKLKKQVFLHNNLPLPNYHSQIFREDPKIIFGFL